MRYDGGKGAMGVAQWIINQIPPHRLYIEPFLGGGAVLRLKKPALSSIAINYAMYLADRKPATSTIDVGTDGNGDATRLIRGHRHCGRVAPAEIA